MVDDEIAIIGVGNVGAALGRRLCASGARVRFGVRPGKDVSELLAACGPNASAELPDAAAGAARVVFLAVPGSAAVQAASELGDLSGKVLVDCNNPLRWDAGPVWTPPPEGSLAQAIQKAQPGARVVKGFNVFGAEFHADPKLSDGAAVDVFLASDDADAKQQVAGIGERAGFAMVDAGPLRNASVLENVAMLWIHLATVGGKGRSFGFKLLSR
jgi:8-hydroxy-5-deazaflavin:NADPH oxidoreductase